MNKKLVRIALTVAFGLMAAGGLRAQDEAPAAPRKPISKGAQEAKAKKVAAKAKAKAEERAKALSLNTATTDQLKQLPGLTPAQVDAIVAKRPYHSKADLVVKGIITAEQYRAISKNIAIK